MGRFLLLVQHFKFYFTCSKNILYNMYSLKILNVEYIIVDNRYNVSQQIPTAYSFLVLD